ncbi:MAG: hypothetical protein WC655_19010, partial [Candidatus Hydrogenedentales bacterium]
MNRREFFRTSAKVAAAGVGVSAITSPINEVRAAEAGAAGSAGSPGGVGASPAILVSYSAEEHRRRLTHIGMCTQQIRQCMRKHLITDYLPAQCVYNMGEYPSREPWAPNEYDEQELDRLKAH